MKRFIILVAFLMAASISAEAQQTISEPQQNAAATEQTAQPQQTTAAKQTAQPQQAAAQNISYEIQKIKDKGITLRMAYDDYKDLYDPHDYIGSPSDYYSPAGSGIASFFIPGLGQIINGQSGKGIGIIAGDVALVAGGIIIGMACTKTNDQGKAVTSTGGAVALVACLAGSLALDIWSIFDAVKVAKIKNLYYRDCEMLQSSSFDVKLLPELALAPTAQGLKPTAGMSLVIRF